MFPKAVNSESSFWLSGERAGGGVKSNGDKLPKGFIHGTKQRELYPQAIVAQLLTSHGVK